MKPKLKALLYGFRRCRKKSLPHQSPAAPLLVPQPQPCHHKSRKNQVNQATGKPRPPNPLPLPPLTPLPIGHIHPACVLHALHLHSVRTCTHHKTDAATDRTPTAHRVSVLTLLVLVPNLSRQGFYHVWHLALCRMRLRSDGLPAGHGRTLSPMCCNLDARLLWRGAFSGAGGGPVRWPKFEFAAFLGQVDRQVTENVFS